MCFMRICDYKFAVYGFFAEHRGHSVTISTQKHHYLGLSCLSLSL